MNTIASDLSYEVALKRIRDKQFHAPQLSKSNQDLLSLQTRVLRLMDDGDTEAEPADSLLTVIDQVRR